ncbi:ABC transporter permease, partial [Listeria monocytogenes]|nr:ABC transporter permease [Listeria monocytogenes]
TFFESFKQSTIKIEKQNVITLIYSSIPKDTNINEGILPKNSNEILITNLLSKKLNKQVGDYVELKSSKEISKKYQIVGKYQTVNNLGMEIQMLDSGYNLISEDSVIFQKSIKFDQLDVADYVINKHKNNIQNVTLINGRSSTDNLISTVQRSVTFISAIVLVCTIILTSIISFLLTLISIKKENKELTIFRNLGVKFNQIRMQYFLRIFFSTLLGLALGTFLYVLFSDLMFNSIMGLVGLTNIDVSISVFHYLFVLIFLFITNIIICLIATRKLKKKNIRG